MSKLWVVPSSVVNSRTYFADWSASSGRVRTTFSPSARPSPARFSPLSSEPATYRYSSETVEPVVLYTVYSAGSTAASELAASEEAATEEATEEAVEEAAVEEEEEEEPQAVMPTASARAAATTAAFFSFIVIESPC